MVGKWRNRWLVFLKFPWLPPMQLDDTNLLCLRRERAALAIHGGLLVGIALGEVVEDLDGLVGLAVLIKEGGMAGDGVEIGRRELTGEIVGLLGFGGKIVRGEEIGLGDGIVRIRQQRVGRAGGFGIGEQLLRGVLPIADGLLRSV